MNTLSNLYHKISQLSTIVVDDPKQSVPVYKIVDLVIYYDYIVKKEVQYSMEKVENSIISFFVVHADLRAMSWYSRFAPWVTSMLAIFFPESW